ncbi:VOC family protein [Nocardioides sp. W3-2-3]|uniref:VOC family protein n=1 Tax=Nocardioides convexus TaxID=2712224 RepID=UPI0024187CFC|nr:VOC family protein [Nocardioides convexus]NHA01079.1 VOC family protein [Nocardioides convexus]
MALATYEALCIDAVDARALGRFWAGVLDLELSVREDGQVRLDGTTPAETIWINAVPEPVTVKQRVHLDVNLHRVEDVLALGATAVDLESFRWKVLRDPEGGEPVRVLRERPARPAAGGAWSWTQPTRRRSRPGGPG